MLNQPKETAYYDGLNGLLLGEVPARARRIVEVGCARGRLGLELKRQDATRYVIGIEYDAQAAAIARDRLDEVHVCDLQISFPDIEPGTVDCVIFGDVLEHLLDPEVVLRRARDLLADDGIVLVCVPNFTHFTILKAILRADPMYQPDGLLDATHIRFFSHATFIKMLLDVGLLPNLVHVIGSGGTDHMIPAATPLLEYFGVDPGRALKFLDAYQYIFSATRIDDPPKQVTPITFVACVNDEDQLQANLLRSPCFHPGSPHQLILLRDQSSAAQGFSAGIAAAEHGIVVLVQQDIYLPAGWDRRFGEQFKIAEERFGAIGVAGCFGLRRVGDGVVHVGRILDRENLLNCPVEMPAAVDVLDEVILGVRSDTTLVPDPALGFHLYGLDLCLSASAQGLTNVVLDATCFHNSLFASLNRAFHSAREEVLRKWPEVRPVYSCMGRLDTMQAAPLQLEVVAQPEPQDLDPGSDPAVLRARAESAERALELVLGSRTWKLRNAVSAGIRRTRGRRRGANRSAPGQSGSGSA